METKITFVGEIKNQIAIGLDSSVFRRAGGGQPCDFGSLSGPAFAANVVNVVQMDDKDVCILGCVKGRPEKGMSIVQRLDERRRLALTRMHTGEHILFKSIKQVLPKLELDKIDLDTKESSIYVLCDSLDYGELLKAELNANKIIRENRHISERFLPKNEAQDYFDIRIKPERIKEDEVRIIEVEGFDISACSGTHCFTTAEVGSVFITRLNALGKGRWQISFSVDPEAQFRYSAYAKEVSAFLQCLPSEILDNVKNLHKDRESYKLQYRNLSKKLLNTLGSVAHKDIQLYAHVLPTMEKKLMQECVVDILEKAKKEDVRVVVVLVSPNQVIMGSSGHINVQKILQEVLSLFGGRGGGRDHFAQGGFPEGDPDKICKELVSRL